MLRRDPTLVHESQTQRQRSPQHGEDLLPIIKGGNHWVLAHVNPQTKTIENFDSFHGSVGSAFDNINVWLKSELRDAFVDSGGTVSQGQG